MFKKAKSTLASLFGQLAELDKEIEDSARRIVERIVDMIDVVDDEAPSSREALIGRDFRWYQEVTNVMTSDGFSPPAAFEPRVWMSRAVESRAIVEYALGDAGTIVGSWYALTATKTRPERRTMNLFTLFEDGGSHETVAGGVASSLPLLDTEREDRLPEGTQISVLLARHRARITAYGSAPRHFVTIGEYHASREERSQQRAALRRGLGLSLVERYIEAEFTGDDAEVGSAYLDAIRKHPEWYKYASVNSEAAVAVSAATARAPTMPLNFLMSSTDDGRRTLSTFGMLFSGLPELLLTGVAANHCRAARVLAGTVASGFARSRGPFGNDTEFVAQLVSLSGTRVTLTLTDAITAGVTQVVGNRNSLPVDVHLTLRGFTVEDEPSMLLLNPLPDESGSLDERLREACARLGVDVPTARGAGTGDEAMREAHEHAVTRMDEIRTRWRTRVASEEKVLVKIRASQGELGEYVWLEVRDWRDGEIDGEAVTPAPRVGLSLGQRITIKESQVYDQLVIAPSGATIPALTDVVATDYGMDI